MIKIISIIAMVYSCILLCFNGNSGDENKVEMILYNKISKKWTIAINSKIYRSGNKLPQNVKKIDINLDESNDNDAVLIVYFDDGTIRKARIGESISDTNDDE